jgi:hypothetical protein
MFERLKRLYKEGRIDEAGLEAAVKKGWITEEELILIIGENNEDETATKTAE